MAWTAISAPPKPKKTSFIAIDTGKCICYNIFSRLQEDENRLNTSSVVVAMAGGFCYVLDENCVYVRNID